MSTRVAESAAAQNSGRISETGPELEAKQEPEAVQEPEPTRNPGATQEPEPTQEPEAARRPEAAREPEAIIEPAAQQQVPQSIAKQKRLDEVHQQEKQEGGCKAKKQKLTNWSAKVPNLLGRPQLPAAKPVPEDQPEVIIPPSAIHLLPPIASPSFSQQGPSSLSPPEPGKLVISTEGAPTNTPANSVIVPPGSANGALLGKARTPKEIIPRVPSSEQAQLPNRTSPGQSSSTPASQPSSSSVAPLNPSDQANQPENDTDSNSDPKLGEGPGSLQLSKLPAVPQSSGGRGATDNSHLWIPEDDGCRCCTRRCGCMRCPQWARAFCWELVNIPVSLWDCIKDCFVRCRFCCRMAN